MALSADRPVETIREAVRDADALPRRSDLPRRQRVVVDATAAMDIGLRTVAAMLVSIAMAPPLFEELRRQPVDRRERDNLRFYSDLGSAQDPAVSFPPPQETPRVTNQPVPSSVSRRTSCQAIDLIFASRFETVNPALAQRWRGLHRNNTVWARWWRHVDGPRPTLCVIHGFGASAHWFNAKFFSARQFYDHGYDIVFFTLPFHGRRAESRSLYSGYGYFAQGLSGFAEAVTQSIHDLRALINYLESVGVPRIAVTGLSLGGFTTALLAAIDERLAAAIPIVPVVAIETGVNDWVPANYVFDLARRVSNIDRSDWVDALAFSSPLNYEPLVRHDARLIITGLGDRLAPPHHAALLWQHWDHCDLCTVIGNHLVHTDQSEYLHRMQNLLDLAAFS